MSIKRKMLLPLGALLIGLTACSGRESENTDQTYTYVPHRIELSAEGGVILSAFLCDDELIYETAADENGLFSQQTFYSLPLTEEDVQPRRIPFELSAAQVELLDIIKDPEGNYYTLERDSAADHTVNGYISQSGYRVGMYSPEGSSLAGWDISRQLLQDSTGSYMHELAMDKNGDICVVGSDTLLLLNSSGEYQGKITAPFITCAARGADGSIYFCSVNQLKRIDFDTAASENVTTGFPIGTGMCLGEDSELWVYDIDGIYRYDTQNQMPTQVLSWLDANVDASSLVDMAVMPDGQIWLLMSELFSYRSQPPQLVSLTKTEGNEPAGETVTVGVMNLTDNMRACAIRFNQNHPECRVQLKEYMGVNGYRDKEDAMRALDLDLVTGKVADIIAISYADMEKYMSKEMLEDLAPYLDASTALSRENLVDVIEKAYTYDGRLAALPTQLGLEVIVGRQSQLGNMQNWSVEDMIAFFEQNNDASILDSTSKDAMLDVCLKFNLGCFVDTQEKTCHFDTEEFSKILEFAAQFTGTGDIQGWSSWSIYQNDRRLLDRQWCQEPCFAACAPQYFDNEPVSYIGYPTMDGQSGIMLMTNYDAYGILTTSAHKEAAWMFLESAILAEGHTNNIRLGIESDISSTAFPIMKNMLEEQFAASLKEAQKEMRPGPDGQPIRNYRTTLGWGEDTIYCYAPLEEEIDLIWELIDQARPAPQHDETIMGIIREEAAGYFAGDKDIELVTAAIQNRVQLYLNEK